MLASFPSLGPLSSTPKVASARQHTRAAGTEGDERIERELFRRPSLPAKPPSQRTPPDFASIRAQLRQHRHLTLRLLGEEYRQAHPDGYGYSHFCDQYQKWRRKLGVVLRQEHKASEKVFVDWAGPTIPVYDRITGVVWQASLFIAVLGARIPKSIVEQDHRNVKRRTWLAKGYGSLPTAWRTLRGIEAAAMRRKGRVRWITKENVVGQAKFISKLFGIAA